MKKPKSAKRTHNSVEDFLADPVWMAAYQKECKEIIARAPREIIVQSPDDGSQIRFRMVPNRPLLYVASL